MFYTILTVFILVMLAGVLSWIVARRMFGCLTGRDNEADRDVQAFLHFEDVYLAGIVKDLYEGKKKAREAGKC